jgi:predicted ATPase/DNA-binding SARP family transcriptional activator
MPSEQANNLPDALSPLIGRAAAIEEIEAALGQTRLLTLAGTGGCGKTCLALRVASEVATNYADGVWFVELGRLLDDTLLPEVVTATLGLRVAPTNTALRTLLAHLRAREVLLVLDNCEHLLPNCAQLAENLLRACPRLTVLATSRELLRSPFEQVWRVPPLEVPDPRASLSSVELQQYGAVQLLVTRVQATVPDFALTTTNAAPIAAICRRLDGLPLALELAAACAGTLAFEQINAQLERSSHLLAGGLRTAPPRQQTLEATMAWSYRLLAPDEQTLFRQLSVLAGEFDLDTAAAVAGSLVEAVIAPLVQLVNKSLVLVVRRESTARYRLLETVRQYAHDQLIAGTEEAQAHERYCDWVERHIAASRTVNNGWPTNWLDTIEHELDHVRAVLGWLIASGQPERALRLATALQSFWRQRGFLTDGTSWLEAGLVSPDASVPPLVRAHALNALGVLRMWQCAYPSAQAAHEEALALFASLGEPVDLAWTHFRLGFLADKRGHYAVAIAQLEESLRRFTALGDADGSDAARNRLGIVAWNQGDYARAQDLLAASETFQRAAGTTGGLASTLLNLGSLALDRSDLARATALFHESLALSATLNDHHAGAYTHAELGTAALLAGDLEQAEQAFRLALAISDPSDNPEIVLTACDGLATIHLACGTPLHAASIWAATEAIRQGYGLRLRPVEQQRREARVITARRAAESGAFAAAWAAGTALSLADVQAMATQLAAAEAQTTAIAVLVPTHRRTESPEPGEPSLRLWGLGAVRIERDGRLLSGRDLTYSRARDLLFYLLTYPERTRDQIGAALWPDANPEQLRTTFRVVMYHLRRALGSPAWIVRDGEYYRFDRTRPHWYDVAAFESAVHTGDRLRQTAPDAAVAAFETARALYQGDFWEGVVESDWIVQTQERLRHHFLNTLLALGYLYLDQSAPHQSLQVFLPATEHDPYCEEAHRGVLRCYLQLRDHGRAAQHYERLRQMLVRELGVSPAPETSALLHPAEKTG